MAISFSTASYLVLGVTEWLSGMTFALRFTETHQVTGSISQTRSLYFFITLWTSWIPSPLSNIPCILKMKCLYGIHDVEGTVCPRDVGRQETLMFPPNVDWAILWWSEKRSRGTRRHEYFPLLTRKLTTCMLWFFFSFLRLQSYCLSTTKYRRHFAQRCWWGEGPPVPTAQDTNYSLLKSHNHCSLVTLTFQNGLRWWRWWRSQ